MTEPVFPSNTWWIKIRGLIGCLGCPGTKRNVGWCQSELNVLSSSSSFAPVWTFSASSNLSPALSRSRSLLFPFVSLSLSLCVSNCPTLSADSQSESPNDGLKIVQSHFYSHTFPPLSLSLSTSSFIWYDAAECLYISSLLREHVSLTFSLTKEMTSIRVLKPMLRDAAHATTTFTRKSSAVDVDETAVRPWWAFQGERLDIDAVRAFSSSIYSARCYCYYRSQIHKCTQTERVLFCAAG